MPTTGCKFWHTMCACWVREAEQASSLLGRNFWNSQSPAPPRDETDSPGLKRSGGAEPRRLAASCPYAEAHCTRLSNSGGDQCWSKFGKNKQVRFLEDVFF